MVIPYGNDTNIGAPFRFSKPILPK
ncbi:hypothetical protein SapgrDRAFT_2930 [Saprospira grandis DSM 2844]|uniref:Uncharacterized protein n=1 Tax=Saprospira grandis DSM 2844 TaxID=694433 RepID=J1I6Y1_9BACT|nr:hypothetical protein SapgrDRAFT_2930 [Saprospira grandis DSM 2844]